MKPILSIIIPCYNTESTLESTLQSVIKQEFQNWEAIIVNDGSQDNLEIIALKYVEKDNRFSYLKKENGGLGSARNYGIKKAQGQYILPLDSDNLVVADFAKKAISVFENNSEIGVVHGNAAYFGEKSGVWNVNQFDITKMLINNYIDACAIFKKELWQKVKGYDEQMPFQGNEDWDFWLSLGKIDTKFYKLNEVTFHYFISSDSMIRSFTTQMRTENRDYLVKKHSLLYYETYKNEFDTFETIKYQHSSKKFILNLFTSTFFRFKIFKL